MKKTQPSTAGFKHGGGDPGDKDCGQPPDIRKGKETFPPGASRKERGPAETLILALLRLLTFRTLRS